MPSASDLLALKETGFDIAGSAVLLDVGPDCSQNLLDRGFQVDAGQLRLLGLQPGRPIDLVAVALRIEEVDSRGDPVADFHVHGP
jgi:hypothetical protein